MAKNSNPTGLGRYFVPADNPCSWPMSRYYYDKHTGTPKKTCWPAHGLETLVRQVGDVPTRGNKQGMLDALADVGKDGPPLRLKHENRLAKHRVYGHKHTDKFNQDRQRDETIAETYKRVYKPCKPSANANLTGDQLDAILMPITRFTVIRYNHASVSEHGLDARVNDLFMDGKKRVSLAIQLDSGQWVGAFVDKTRKKAEVFDPLHDTDNLTRIGTSLTDITGLPYVTNHTRKTGSTNHSGYYVLWFILSKLSKKRMDVIDTESVAVGHLRDVLFRDCGDDETEFASPVEITMPEVVNQPSVTPEVAAEIVELVRAPDEVIPFSQLHDHLSEEARGVLFEIFQEQQSGSSASRSAARKSPKQKSPKTKTPEAESTSTPSIFDYLSEKEGERLVELARQLGDESGSGRKSKSPASPKQRPSSEEMGVIDSTLRVLGKSVPAGRDPVEYFAELMDQGDIRDDDGIDEVAAKLNDMVLESRHMTLDEAMSILMSPGKKKSPVKRVTPIKPSSTASRAKFFHSEKLGKKSTTPSTPPSVGKVMSPRLATHASPSRVPPNYRTMRSDENPLVMKMEHVYRTHPEEIVKPTTLDIGPGQKGAFAPFKLEYGDIIGRYRGKVIKKGDPLFAQIENDKDDKIDGEYMMTVNDGSEHYYIDAKHSRHWTRYINHQPTQRRGPGPRANLMVEGGTPWFKVTKRGGIKKGEELFFDYGGEYAKHLADLSATRKSTRQRKPRSK